MKKKNQLCCYYTLNISQMLISNRSYCYSVIVIAFKCNISVSWLDGKGKILLASCFPWRRYAIALSELAYSQYEIFWIYYCLLTSYSVRGKYLIKVYCHSFLRFKWNIKFYDMCSILDDGFIIFQWIILSDTRRNIDGELVIVIKIWNIFAAFIYVQDNFFWILDTICKILQGKTHLSPLYAILKCYQNYILWKDRQEFSLPTDFQWKMQLLQNWHFLQGYLNFDILNVLFWVQ